ncbi:MAG: hypothetical protein EZS28_014946, partial [Streblomastix strix]
MQHSDYISGYMQLGEPVNQLTSSGVRYTRAPLAARGTATCSLVQTCQVNWTITIPANILAIQLNRCEVAGGDEDELNARVNFIANNDLAAAPENMTQNRQKYYGKTADGEEKSEHLKFWLGFSTACGPLNYVSPLESIIAGKRHCGIFMDIPLSDIDLQATVAEGQPRTPYYF